LVLQAGKAEGKEGRGKLAAAHATLEKAEARIAELQVGGACQWWLAAVAAFSRVELLFQGLNRRNGGSLRRNSHCGV